MTALDHLFAIDQLLDHLADHHGQLMVANRPLDKHLHVALERAHSRLHRQGVILDAHPIGHQWMVRTS
jgi:hypothetical protein